MKEYSLESLKNDTGGVVSKVRNPVFISNNPDGSDEEETYITNRVTKTSSEAIKLGTKHSQEETLEATKVLTNEDSPSSHVSHAHTKKQTDSEMADDSFINDHANEFDFTTTAPPATTTAPWPEVPAITPTLAPAPAKNTSAYDSVTPISHTSENATSMSGGAISGIVVGVACLVFVVAAFVTIKKRAASQHFSLSKLPSAFGESRAMSLTSSKLAPPGAFGRLNSGRNETEEPNMSGIFKVTHDDPFTKRYMRKGGIWDDPVLTAARIPLEKIQMQELIARGGFGQVFLASYNGQTVAVKTLLPETAEDMDEINALFAETKIIAKLEHPCIVNFIGIAWESFSTICCVTEYMVGGDLRALLNHFLVNHTRPRGFDHDKVKIALDIAHGLTYLHSMEPNILHRDLKSRNVLLNSQLNAKLTDFGVSRERSDGMMTNAVGTSLWMAPEIMLGSHYDGKADVFSFGVLLSELDTHSLPYANVRNANGRKPSETTILRKVAAGELQVEFSRNCPVELLKLAQACISVNPKDRPTARDALSRLEDALTTFEVEEVAL